MHYAQVLSRANQGLDAPPVQVEVHIANGLPAFTVVGMPETAVRESKDRVRSAILNSHFEFPDRRITVNLAPADLPKGGGRFDLPIALGILIASGQVPDHALTNTECIGELALDGALRPIRGAVTAVIAAKQAGRRVALPLQRSEVCEQVKGAKLLPARDLLSCCAILQGRAPASVPAYSQPPLADNHEELGLVTGQLIARRALEIAASGSHNLLFSGPPGTGKSLLARCLPGILPPMAPSEQVTVAALYDLLGETPRQGTRSFRAPHHSASAAALIGGGSIPRPGEASLAHGGVLFLDELPEFSRHTLDMLREPLETGEIAIARARARIRYPARFQLVAAMNPCPCGYAGDHRKPCNCSEAQRKNYRARVSGPLLDRIDLQVSVVRESNVALINVLGTQDTQGALGEDRCGALSGETSKVVRERVERCHALQIDRQGHANAQLDAQQLTEHCAIDEPERRLLARAAESLCLSPRAIHRCLRVARTISDMRGEGKIGSQALSEALGYRMSVGD